MQPWLSVTIRCVPVASAFPSFRFIRRSATSGYSKLNDPPNPHSSLLNRLEPDDWFVVHEDRRGLTRRVRAGDVVDIEPEVPAPFVPEENLVGRAFAVFWPVYLPPLHRGATRLGLIR